MDIRNESSESKLKARAYPVFSNIKKTQKKVIYF
ncbi:hypothetical protein NBC122_02513 [Chryseobacterium salivictor]|uniref:Uncharacterized protein n=1 Tax=Chryseobacterium salivictor TaxID=2547600 RepID=A0A4P6ZIE9_9FLAO|nr:hypothetical protein NBC122_02513 [Chryseobacterium salivictor]